MALPRSTFVMGAVVLALFGLAIRETATTKEPEPEPELDTEEAYMRHMQEVAAAHAEATAAERQHFDEVLAIARTLTGAEAASLGSAFAGLALGRDREALPEATQDALRELRARTASEIDYGPSDRGPIARISLDLFTGEAESRDRLCARLDAQLHDAWGGGQRSDTDGPTIWLNPTTHQRASFDVADDGCGLVFETYVAPGDWLGALSLDLVGKPAATAMKVTGAVPSEDGLAWELPGVGAGTTPTRLTATLDARQRITSITARTTATEETGAELAAQLIAKLGAPKRSPAADAPEAQSLTWPRRGLVLELGGGDVTLTAGKP